MTADVAERLARQPLVESLALGLPSRLPSVAAEPVAVAAGSSTLSDLIVRAKELDDARHPAAEQAWARVGRAGGVDLPAEIAARVSEVAAFNLLADDPGVARKTLLDVAESYVALQDRPASFRARSSAARALAVTGDHAAAVAESAELAAAAGVAFATGELEAQHYLSVRMSEQMIAVYVLNVSENRTPAEIDVVVNGLTNTVALVSRYGDQDHVGRCHEMLAQAGSWRRSQEELIQHLKTAHDAYLAAAEPWFAVRPAAALAEFALQSGDAVLAEQYARALRAIGQHTEAAEQFLEAAHTIADDPANIKAQASLAAAAAESLRKAGQEEAALAAFRRAAVLFDEAGNVVNRVRCLRSAAWLEFFSAGDTNPGVGDRPGDRAGIATMTAVLTELETLVPGDASAELATELTNTRDQLAEMVNERANPDAAQG